MKTNDYLQPSFTMDPVGIEKYRKYLIVEVGEEYSYIRTAFGILFPVHRSKIVFEKDLFEHQASNVLRSKTWRYIDGEKKAEIN